MEASVLIAYSTRSGSTREVAEAMGASIWEMGLPADVMPMEQVVSLAGRTLVILGAPLYMGKFPKEFHRFVAVHRDVLQILRPWFFVLGPTRTDPKDFEAAHTQALKQLRRYPWLRPIDLRIFGGRWNVKNLPFPFSLARHLPGHPLEKIPSADIRNWAEIEEWTLSIGRQAILPPP
jgi:menaquinone-dependent protoporphyrinogen oxidase